MRALELEVFDAVYAAVAPLLPEPEDRHPLGCHRRRVPDRICLWAMLVRLTTGCSWVDAERLCGGVSDTTLRSRRDEWAQARASGTCAVRPTATPAPGSVASCGRSGSVGSGGEDLAGGSGVSIHQSSVRWSVGNPHSEKNHACVRHRDHDGAECNESRPGHGENRSPHFDCPPLKWTTMPRPCFFWGD